jgi:hypothetical protein
MVLAASVAPKPARAQIVYANPIPNDVKTSPNALTQGQMTVIGNFVDAEMANLKSGKAENEKAARKALEDAAVAVGDPRASAQYLSGYGMVVDQKMAQLVSSNQPLQVRLNAGIALAHVAARTDNGTLKNSTTALVLDNSEPVALWGVKAAKYVVPHLLDLGTAGPLDAAIVNAVGKFKNDGAIVEDAYDDFTGDMIQVGSEASPAPATRLSAAIDPLVKLMEMRAAVYAAAQTAPQVGDGPDLPAEPEADNRAFLIIASPTVWKAAKPTQQALMCRAGLDLIDQIIPLVDATPPRTPNVDPPELLRKEDLIAVITHAGSAFKVLAALTNESPGGPISTAAGMLTPGSVNAQTPSATIKDRLSALEAALTAVNLVAPAMPLPPIPSKVAPATSTPPARPAATPTASGLPARASH